MPDQKPIRDAARRRRLAADRVRYDERRRRRAVAMLRYYEQRLVERRAVGKPTKRIERALAHWRALLGDEEET